MYSNQYRKKFNNDISRSDSFAEIVVVKNFDSSAEQQPNIKWNIISQIHAQINKDRKSCFHNQQLSA